jgi:ribonuclease J
MTLAIELDGVGKRYRLGEHHGTGTDLRETRGFADPGPLLDEMRNEAHRVLVDAVRANHTEIKLLQEHLHDAVGQLVYERTGRRPMILPVIVEV